MKAKKYLKLANYVKLIAIDNGNKLQLGSGSLCFIVDQDLEMFIEICNLLKQGIYLKDLLNFMKDNNVSQYIQNMIEILITKKEFFFQFEYNKDYRYSRHLAYYNLSFPNYNPIGIQKNIEKSNIAVLGCGGIGNLLSVQLVASGIKNITLIDDDIVEETNLTRQIIYNEKDIGKFKVDILKNKIEEIDNTSKVIAVKEKILNWQSLYNIAKFDLIIVSADTPNNILLIMGEYVKEVDSSFVSVGYIQDIAVYGPIVNKENYDMFIKGFNKHISLPIKDGLKDKIIDFNKSYQAPSFGPLNMLAVSVSCRDIIMYLAGIKNYNCSNKRIGIYPNLKVEEQIFW